MPATARAERLVIEEPASPPTLTALAAEWSRAYAQAEAASRALKAAQTEADKAYPPEPPGGIYSDAAGPERPLRDWWWYQARRIDAELGVTALDEACNDAFRIAGKIADRLLAMHPTTIQEATLKYAILLERNSDGTGGFDTPAPVFAFLHDLELVAQLDRQP